MYLSEQIQVLEQVRGFVEAQGLDVDVIQPNQLVAHTDHAAVLRWAALSVAQLVQSLYEHEPFVGHK